MNKFYIGEPVLYINGDKYNIGIIKSRHELPPKYFWKGFFKSKVYTKKLNKLLH